MENQYTTRKTFFSGFVFSHLEMYRQLHQYFSFLFLFKVLVQTHKQTGGKKSEICSEKTVQVLFQNWDPCLLKDNTTYTED